ncbi:melatonin-related receptor-like [Paramacrobiotus metropolitanus]|uniref:melatonin-related receptor-like n=1 Tax=Paramacrobiotus metropolitanus TaxID=2943436 RepID=UPI0024464DD2|nr:melatonin-related receptor-like [Paramacrobiotus metropolitanus]
METVSSSAHPPIPHMVDYNVPAITVEASYLQEHPHLQVIFAVLLLLASVVGIFGNILVILTVSLTKALRLPSNIFIVNLAIADLIVTTLVDPFNVIGAFVGQTYFDTHRTLCHFIAAMCAPACLCSMFSITAISVNRYIMICHISLYHRLYTWRNTCLMCVALWLISTGIHFPNHVGWGDNAFDPAYYICTFSIATHSYAIFYIVVGVFLPLSIVCFSYASIFRYHVLVKKGIRRHRKREVHYTVIRRKSRESISMTLLSVAAVARSTVVSGTVPVSGKDGGSSDVRRRSTFRGNGFTTEDIKLAKTLFTVCIAFLICWSPFALFVLMHQPSWIPGWLYMIAIMMAHGNSSINCILYGVTNARFRQGYRAVLGLTGGLPRSSGNPEAGRTLEALGISVSASKQSLRPDTSSAPGRTSTANPERSHSDPPKTEETLHLMPPNMTKQCYS